MTMLLWYLHEFFLLPHSHIQFFSWPVSVSRMWNSFIFRNTKTSNKQLFNSHVVSISFPQRICTPFEERQIGTSKILFKCCLLCVIYWNVIELNRKGNHITVPDSSKYYVLNMRNCQSFYFFKILTKNSFYKFVSFLPHWTNSKFKSDLIWLNK